MTVTVSTPARHAAQIVEDLDARIRAALELEDIAAPDIVPALRRERIAAELALADLLAPADAI